MFLYREGDVSIVRERRNHICDLMELPHPVMMKSKTVKAKPHHSTEMASYRGQLTFIKSIIIL